LLRWFGNCQKYLQINQLKKIDRFAEKYKLWLVVPIVIVVGIAFKSFDAALGFAIFFMVLWCIGGLMSFVGWLLEKTLLRTAPLEIRQEVQSSIGVSVFLGACAILGMVLRGENMISSMIAQHAPQGLSLSFIDPTFAAVCIIGIWIYTGYKINS